MKRIHTNGKNQRFQDVETAREIETAVDLSLRTSPEQLLADLEEMDGIFRAYSIMSDLRPTKVQFCKELGKIEKQATKLARSLGVVGGADIRGTKPRLFQELDQTASRFAKRKGPYPGSRPTPYESDDGQRKMDYGTAEVVLNATRGVWWLLQWIEAARKEAEAARKETPVADRRRERAARHEAKKWLIGTAIPKAYEHHFEQAFGWTMPWMGNAPPDAPGIRFATEVLKLLGESMRPDAIVKAYQRHAP